MNFRNVPVLPSSGIIQNLEDLLFWESGWRKSRSGFGEGKQTRYLVVNVPKKGEQTARKS
jgi:hypothetical protein